MVITHDNCCDTLGGGGDLRPLQTESETSRLIRPTFQFNPNPLPALVALAMTIKNGEAGHTVYTYMATII